VEIEHGRTQRRSSLLSERCANLNEKPPAELPPKNRNLLRQFNRPTQSTEEVIIADFMKSAIMAGRIAL
jgi:hypothetical protein